MTQASKVKIALRTLLAAGLVAACYYAFRPCEAHSPLTTIESYSEAQPVLDKLGADDLVLFDVDDTLIASPDVLANWHYPSWINLIFFWHLPSLIWPSNQQELVGFGMQLPPRVLIEQDIPNLISWLKDRGVAVLGLTNMVSGSAGTLKSAPEWRYQTLEQLGVIFSQQFPDTVFKQFKVYKKHYPVLYKGILCTNLISKGDLLGAFLDAMHFKPKRIICFDDRTERLQQVGAECHKRKIPCMLYHYLGSSRVYDKKNWSTKRAIIQLKELYYNHRWVSDAETDAMLAAGHKAPAGRVS